MSSEMLNGRNGRAIYSAPDRCPNSSNGHSKQWQQDNRLRLDGPYPALVRGVDADGQAFEEKTVLDSVSAGAICLRLLRCVAENGRLLILFQFSSTTPGAMGVLGPRVAVRGVVQSVQPQPDGTYGVAVEFQRHRFL